MTERNNFGCGIMNRLREETMDLHREAEQGQFLRGLMAGRLPLEQYTELLHELLHVHVTVESDLRRLAKTEETIRLALRPYQFQETQLLRDLHFFERTPETAANLPATRRLISEIEALARRDPVALLGVHYVFEGSKNGGRLIAKAMRRGYGLLNGGLGYLDPYGELQQARWQEFKIGMEQATFAAGQQDTIVEAAQMTFRGIIRIHEELFATAAARPEAS